MPYLVCPGCGVRQYTPPLHVRRRSCPVCDKELSAGSLPRRAAGRDRRAALILRTAGDLSHDEVAYVLDLAPAEARNLLVKARVTLAAAGEARKRSVTKVS